MRPSRCLLVLVRVVVQPQGLGGAVPHRAGHVRAESGRWVFGQDGDLAALGHGEHLGRLDLAHRMPLAQIEIGAHPHGRSRSGASGWSSISATDTPRGAETTVDTAAAMSEARRK